MVRIQIRLLHNSAKHVHYKAVLGTSSVGDPFGEPIIDGLLMIGGDVARPILDFNSN